MANEWTYKYGPVIPITMPSETTIAKGTPCYESSNLIVATADGGTVDMVCMEAVTSGNVARCDIPLGAVYLVKAAAGTDFNIGDDAYAAASNTIDGGTAGNIKIGNIVNYNPASGGCADIAVLSQWLHPITHA